MDGKLLIATTNPGKLAEFRKFLGVTGLTVVSLTDLGITAKPVENGTTYEENARIKAEFYRSLTDLPIIADDGGFEIDALGGEPGVKSHRWVNVDREDEDEETIAYTMKRLSGIPAEKRGAQLRVVIGYLSPGGPWHASEAVIRGIIPEKPAPFRRKGFPYRSLLYLPEFHAFYHDNDLPEEINEKLNHRKQALGKLIPLILASLTKGQEKRDTRG